MYLKFVCSQCKWVCLKNRVHQNPMVYHGLSSFMMIFEYTISRHSTFACTVSLHGICWTLSKFFSRGGPHAVEYYQIDVIIIIYTRLYYTILYYTTLHYTILYYTILYYTILYYTILYITYIH